MHYPAKYCLQARALGSTALSRFTGRERRIIHTRDVERFKTQTRIDLIFGGGIWGAFSWFIVSPEAASGTAGKKRTLHVLCLNKRQTWMFQLLAFFCSSLAVVKYFMAYHTGVALSSTFSSSTLTTLSFKFILG